MSSRRKGGTCTHTACREGSYFFAFSFASVLGMWRVRILYLPGTHPPTHPRANSQTSRWLALSLWLVACGLCVHIEFGKRTGLSSRKCGCHSRQSAPVSTCGGGSLSYLFSLFGVTTGGEEERKCYSELTRAKLGQKLQVRRELQKVTINGKYNG